MLTELWICAATFAFIVFVVCLAIEYTQTQPTSKNVQTVAQHAQTLMLQPALLKIPPSRSLLDIEFAVAQHTGTLRLFMTTTEDPKSVLLYKVYLGPGSYTHNSAKTSFTDAVMLVVPVSVEQDVVVDGAKTTYNAYSGCSVLVSDAQV